VNKKEKTRQALWIPRYSASISTEVMYWKSVWEVEIKKRKKKTDLVDLCSKFNYLKESIR